MSMTYPHPVLDPNAQAKSMIDAVTGHQPSPLDSEYSSETPTRPKQKPTRKTSNLVGWTTSSQAAGKQVAGDVAKGVPQGARSHAL